MQVDFNAPRAPSRAQAEETGASNSHDIAGAEHASFDQLLAERRERGPIAFAAAGLLFTHPVPQIPSDCASTALPTPAPANQASAVVDVRQPKETDAVGFETDLTNPPNIIVDHQTSGFDAARATASPPGQAISNNNRISPQPAPFAAPNAETWAASIKQAAPVQSRSLGVVQAQTQNSAIAVAVHATDLGLNVFARVGRMSPTALVRLRHSVMEVLALFGEPSARVNIVGADNGVEGD